MAYDVGLITRELQSAFKLFDNAGNLDTRDDVVVLELEEAQGDATNLATPENVGVLLSALDDITTSLASERMRLAIEIGAVPGHPGLGLIDVLIGAETDADVKHWDDDFNAWRQRLVGYHAEVSKAPPGDRADILWSVTAPLLLGFYGGENSNAPQQPIDAITPFSLANRLNVSQEWREERLRLLREDIADNAKKVVTTGAGIGGAVVVGAVLLALILRR